MRHQETRLYQNVAVKISAAIFLLVVMTGVVLAQTGPPAGAGPPGNNSPRLENRDREIREDQLRSTELHASVDNQNQQRLQAAILQMKEDFAHLQIVRNEIARNLVARKPLDFPRLTEQSGEINKRSNRLKLYMLPQTGEKKDEQEESRAELKSEEMTSALVRLCKLIDSFVENPALKNAATVGAQQLEKAKADKAKADSDLLGIIELSNSIKKSAEKLDQTRQ